MAAQKPQVLAAFVCVFALIGCGSEAPAESVGTLQVVSSDPTDLPLLNLPGEWSRRFTTGDALFERPYSDTLGLGPVYIRPRCDSCHARDGRGPGAVRKMVLVDGDGRTPAEDQSALAYGHTVRPLLAAGAALGITVPEDRSDVLVTKREPPAVFGRGYLEAVLDSEIMRVESEQEEHGRVSGRINWVEYYSEPNPDTRYHSSQKGVPLIGRFGLKARIASLDEFAADAFQGDMGITSPLRPKELPNPSSEDDDVPGIDIDADTVNLVADYMRVLRIPRRGPSAEDAHNAKLFETTGCAECHVPALRTRDDYPVSDLAGIDAPVYTDFLLHDMGPDFSDGLHDSEAEGSEWRTAPLLGLRHLQRYLHDGRAETLEDAIEVHGGEGSEAAESVARFRALPKNQREALLEFVSAL